MTDLGPTPEQLSRMRSSILTDIAVRHRVTRRRAVGFSLAAVVAIGTSAAAIAITQVSTDQANTSFDCYSVADLRAKHTTTALVDDARDAFTLLPLADRITAAIDACQVSWSAVPDQPYPGSGPVAVENPTVCVLPDRRLGVFPNPADQPTHLFCESLGVAPPARAEPTD